MERNGVEYHDESFPGANFPPGTQVSFTHEDGTVYYGKVTQLFKNKARVATGDSMYQVDYRLLTRVGPSIVKTTLQDAIEMATDIFEEYELGEKGWYFGFDMTKRRGGVCKYKQKFILLSVTFVMASDREEVRDTILHEVAHAIVGYGHAHDKVWQATARKIGCNGDRCHTVKHTIAKYVGTCKCEGYLWERHRLTQRSRTGTCKHCHNLIDWKMNTEGTTKTEYKEKVEGTKSPQSEVHDLWDELMGT